VIGPPPAYFRVPSGRRIAYRTYGPVAGRPTFYFHGSGGNGLAPQLHTWGRELGLRFVAPDRPGLGHSDADRGRTIADTASDMALLADALGWARFSCVGVSGGGPYALACAALLPDRIDRAVCASGIGPPSAPTSGQPAERLAAMRKQLDRGVTRTALRQLPAQLLQVLVLAHFAEPLMRRQATSKALPPEDRAAVARPDVMEAQVAMVRSARIRDVLGSAVESQLYLQPWPFSLEAIRVPVDVWVGAADNAVAPESGRWLADRIPGATFTQVEDAGHAMAFVHWRQMLAPLAKTTG
jgi:pimeloyl-ACP methyl ester carboxylesterase